VVVNNEPKLVAQEVVSKFLDLVYYCQYFPFQGRVIILRLVEEAASIGYRLIMLPLDVLDKHDAHHDVKGIRVYMEGLEPIQNKEYRHLGIHSLELSKASWPSGSQSQVQLKIYSITQRHPFKLVRHPFIFRG